MFPIVLVISSCSQTPALDIISRKLQNSQSYPTSLHSSRSFTDIRKTPNDDKTQDYENQILYIHELKTKYYNVSIALLPVQNTQNLTGALKDNVEGVLVYFDSKDVSIFVKGESC